VSFEELQFGPDVHNDASCFVLSCRAKVSKRFVRGQGLEVGAGNRPFPLPDCAVCYYGDVRDPVAIRSYFQDASASASFDGRLDAQTFAGVASDSQDFVISAHVIEHLENPIGGIEQALRILKPGGRLVMAVPDRRHTFDQGRPATSLIHLLQDAKDGGVTTRLLAHEEHARFVHRTITGEVLSEDQILESAFRTMAAGMDVHFHCWSTDEFLELADYCCDRFGGHLLAVGREIINENIFVIEAI